MRSVVTYHVCPGISGAAVVDVVGDVDVDIDAAPKAASRTGLRIESKRTDQLQVFAASQSYGEIASGSQLSAS